MSKTLTPEQILLEVMACGDDWVSMTIAKNIALQQLDQYYLNLFMECLEPNENVVGPRTEARNQLRQQTLNNLKNKLGVDKD